MTKLFGANWRTSLWGYITLICAAIVAVPTVIDFLPDSIENYVRGFAGLIALVSGGAFVRNVKDKSVTGGTVQQTAEGQVASIGSQMSSSVLETKTARPKD